MNPDLPVWLVAIIDRLLVKDPAQRFQSAADLAELLGQCLAHVEQPSRVPPPLIVVRPVARPPALSTQAKSDGRNTKMVWTLVATSLVALLGFGAWHVWIREKDERENTPFRSGGGGSGVNLELPFMKIQASDDGKVDMNVGGIKIKADPEGDVELKISPFDFDIESLDKLFKSLHEGIKK
ncbi:MAG: hypothetical protein IH991_02780 [Planctomycetes bacterium]|nr:hypothetical protein [Planctomycetota bacterium]